MKVHLTNLLQNYGNEVPDKQVYDENLRLSVAADDYDYESVGCVEHHFDPGYSMCPDNTEFLAFVAGRTKRIKVHTTAVIIPWNEPVRVVSKIALLDNLADGRLIFGMGRGLARREFEGFGLEMGESRERFDEAAAMIIRGLEDGYVEGDGKYYMQKRVSIHPQPLASFRDRTTAVAMSPDSCVAVGRLGVQMMAFVQGPVETMHLPMIEQYREAFRASQGREAPGPLMIDLTYCHEDAEEAERVARQHSKNYYLTCVEHYEFGGRHFAETKGYTSYAQAKEAIDTMGLDAVVETYADGQIYGTPEQIVEKYRARQEVVGDLEPIMVFHYGGLAGQQAEESFKLFSEKCLPELRKL